MNRSARTAETVSDVYLALMLSAFLLWTGPDGYTKILEAKYRLFLLLTIVYCAAARCLYCGRSERSASASCCVPSARLNG